VHSAVPHTYYPAAPLIDVEEVMSLRGVVEAEKSVVENRELSDRKTIQ
jgi:hypothetical protein